MTCELRANEAEKIKFGLAVYKTGRGADPYHHLITVS